MLASTIEISRILTILRITIQPVQFTAQTKYLSTSERAQTKEQCNVMHYFASAINAEKF
jgi:hypothetical protein